MKRKIVISSLGNVLEWFDFGLFIFMAPIIGAQFFPHESAATRDALIVFAAGFLCRPLGGIFFGYFGDTRGRAKALRISILIISLSTFLIGIMPAYKDIGIAAPILFTLLRLIQGLSIGGEYSGIMIYLAEIAPDNKRGLFTSFAAAGANLGFLVATVTFMLLNLFFSADSINDWAWRIPFIFAGLFGSVLIYYRFKLSETPVYAQLEKQHNLKNIPFITAINYAPRQLIKILGLTCISSTFYYVFFGYMPTYLKHCIDLSLSSTLLIQSGLIISTLFLVPLAGICGDYSSRKKMLVITTLAMILLIIPCFYLLKTNSIGLIALALSTATILSSFNQGNILAAIVENCPENIRYSGIAFSYNLGNAVFGGTTPLIVVVLIDQFNLIAPAYYLLVMACISLLSTATLLRNNQSLGPLNKGT